MTGAALVVQGDTLRLPLPDGSVDLVVTSPPYAFLRNYNTGYPDLEIGSEPTPQAFLEALWAATAEMMRVLKPTGSCFVNLGDKYAERGGPERDAMADGGQVVYRAVRPRRRGEAETGMRQKSLMLLPERYRVGAVDRLGLIARAVIVWDKPNGLPESVTDRVRRSHEDWVHLVKQPRYYSATDEVREPHMASTMQRGGGRNGLRVRPEPNPSGTLEQGRHDWEGGVHPLGKLPGSVWTIGGQIWDGPINFCPRCGRDLTAGNGRAGRNERVTVSSGSPESAIDEPTVSPTNSGSAPSPTASPSTTSAATEDASDLTTLNPSPSASTFTEATPQQLATPLRPTATMGTSSPLPPPTPGLVVSESARCVCETGCESAVPGSVWSVPSEPRRLPEHLGVQHYAAFPSEWPRRLILGWSPPGICLDCGQGRVPVVDKRYEKLANHLTDKKQGNAGNHWDSTTAPYGMARAEATILGYACSCTPYTDHPGTGTAHDQDELVEGRLAGLYQQGSEFSNRPTMGSLQHYERVGPWREYHLDGWQPPPTRPAIILDPFGGTGTTAMVARALGRIGVSVDLSFPYCRAARWRVRHDGAKAISRTNLERQGSLL